MNNQPLQKDTEIYNPEINNTGSNSFENVPYELIVTILPFLGLQDMGNLASVNREFRRIITNAFTNPNMYTAYPGMFEALCKFWHENPVAFNKWFKLYRIDKIQTAPHRVNQRDQACDYIFNAFQLTDGSVDRNILNNVLGTVFQNSTDDITQFLLPLVSNASQFALYRTFGNTTLQEALEAQIATWDNETVMSKDNIHTLLFCLLSSKDIKFFNGKHQVLNPMLDYAEKNMNEIFGQETIRKYGEGFIKALLQSCRLTLAAANETMATVVRINDIRSTFPNVPINLAGADLRGTNLTHADLTSANLEGADLTSANLEDANLWNANLMYANLWGANLTDANLVKANLTGAKLGNANWGGANLTGANLIGANLTNANLCSANLFKCTLSANTKLDGIKINSTALLRVFIDGRNPPNATTNIWSLNDERIYTFKLLLPHAEIKELEVLMKDVKEKISVNFLDAIFCPLRKAQILKLISDEIAKKQAQQKTESKKAPQKEVKSENPQSNSTTINSALELPNQSEDTLNNELNEQDENQEANLMI